MVDTAIKTVLEKKLDVLTSELNKIKEQLTNLSTNDLKDTSMDDYNIEYLHTQEYVTDNLVYQKKRYSVTYAFVFSKDYSTMRIGKSICSDKDRYNKKMGNKIALERALSENTKEWTFEEALPYLQMYFSYGVYNSVELGRMVKRLLQKKILNSFEFIPVKSIYIALINTDVDRLGKAPSTEINYLDLDPENYS